MEGAQIKGEGEVGLNLGLSNPPGKFSRLLRFQAAVTCSCLIRNSFFIIIIIAKVFFMFPGISSPVGTARFQEQGSWDWLAHRGPQSCPSSRRRCGVPRPGSTGNLPLPGPHRLSLGGPRREAGAGAGGQCWAAPELPEMKPSGIKTLPRLIEDQPKSNRLDHF